jgi:hypothetical protein
MKPQNSSPIVYFLFRLPFLLAMCFLAGTLAAAQSGHGIITGSAGDREGAVLQGAQVKIQPGEITVAHGWPKANLPSLGWLRALTQSRFLRLAFRLSRSR